MGLAGLVDGFGEALTWCTVGWAVFAIGATTGTGVVLLWAIANLACLVNALTGRFRIDGGVGLLLGLAVWTLIQSVSFPLPVIATFDANLAQTWEQTLLLLEQPARASASLQPLTTRLEAMKLWSYAVTWGCMAAVVARRGTDAVVRGVVWLVVALVVVTLVHRLLGLQRVYTWYQPQQVQPEWVGPLLNMNNLGGLCNLGVFAALALTCRSTAPDKHWFVFVGIALGLSVMTLLTASRGAVGTLGLGVLGLSVLVWRRRASVLLRHWAAVALVAVGLMSCALVFDHERLLGNLGDLSLEKANLTKWALKVVAVHGFWGVGKGALQAEIPTVQSEVGLRLIPYAECFPVDWATAWGVPVAFVVFALVLRALWTPKGGLRTNVLRLSLGVVLLQNLFDLGFEVPGLVLPWLCVFTAFAKLAPEATGKHARSVPLVALGVFVALVFGLGLPRRSAAETRYELARQLSHGSGLTREELERALLSNPGDHSLLRMAALYSATRGEPKTMAWLNASLLRAPNCALSYLTLGQVLWQQGATSQALGAFRRAARDPSVHDELQSWLAGRAPLALIDVAPPGRLGATFLRRAAGVHTEPGVREMLLQAAIERAPDDLTARLDYLEWRVGARLLGQDNGCVRADCVAALSVEVETAAALATEADGRDVRLRLELLRVRVLGLRGDEEAAMKAFLPACQDTPNDVRCATVGLELGRKLGGEAFDDAAVRYLDAFCIRSARCDTERLAVADELANAGRLVAAHRQYVLSAAFGTNARAFLGAANVAARLGREREALHWLSKGEQKFGPDPRFAVERQSMGVDESTLELGPTKP